MDCYSRATAINTIYMATKTFKETALRIIAVIGLIAVLVLGAWGIIQLAFAIPSFFGGAARTEDSRETLTASVPLSVVSGQAFPISWSHKNFSGEYSYKISYSCAEGVTMQGFLPTGETKEVACQTPFNFVNAASSTGLVAVLKGDKNAQVSIKVEATKLSTGAVTASATANTTVAPAKAPTAKPSSGSSSSTAKKIPSSSSSSSYVPAARAAQLNGYPDLALKVTSYPTAVYAGQQVALQFVIENKGTNVSPANWTFNATLPYVPSYQYQSPGQQALYPGDKIVYTLTYDASGAQSGTQSAQVAVDPYNYVLESNEGNNFGSAVYTLYGGYQYNNQNYWNYPYNSQPYDSYQWQNYNYGFPGYGTGNQWGGYYQNY